ncbi:MAG: helix-turn-helix transcriptional regulator [Oscillibacter sp.]|nr:helix-turn-helix transcriptional regulator [Oscillibacter sp.]
MIGELLAEVRKDHGDTQASLAQKLHVTVSAVRSWEQDKSSPPHETLVSICKLYQVSADYLLGLTRVDPMYVQRRRLENFTQEELDQLRDFEEFLRWRKGKK